jgi:hypothetical protein
VALGFLSYPTWAVGYVARVVAGFFPTGANHKGQEKRVGMNYRAGYSRIVGYDRIVGAAADNAAYAAEASRRALRGAGVGPGYGDMPQVVRDTNGPLRAFPMGFFSAAVGKSAQATVTEKPQVIFRGSRLVLPDELTPGTPIGNPFRLNDLKVGQRSQFVSATRIPSVIFAFQGVGVALSLDTCSTGQDITLVVTNTDSLATHDFEAALIGDCQLPG